MENPTPSGDRIAKVLARAGIASRREAERFIAAGRVAVNGKTLATPAVKVTARDKITVDGKPLPSKERVRMWLYHKPAGLVVTNRDEKGRETIYDQLPKDLPRVMTVGRLDINSEGLLLLTNDGELARALELPATGWSRHYRARAYGRVTQEELDALKDGITIEGVPTGPILAEFERQQGNNAWINVTLREGKNREVRRALETLNLQVNRLIRVSYGPFQLANLKKGGVEEIRPSLLRDQVGHLVTIDMPKQGETLTQKKAEKFSTKTQAAKKAPKPTRTRRPKPKAKPGQAGYKGRHR